MTVIDLHDFCREVDCTYDGELYSARDNGAVLRHPREGRRPRPTDDQWTFGKPNDKNGYMEIASVRVHRIVATAFHGNPPTQEHVVDHIDTNRRNNRPENLRWLTRLENALKNPITVKRIEFICGSIEAFLADPSKLHQSDLDPSFQWMRAVSKQEAQSCLERMHLWAKSDKPSSGGSLGEWVFKPIAAENQFMQRTLESHDLTIERPPRAVQPKREMSPEFSFPRVMPESELVMAKTPGAAQRKWRVPSEFPCCPQQSGEEPIVTYAERLETGAIFSQNHLSKSAVLEIAVADDNKSLWVMCEQRMENPIKPWSLAQITYENGLYIHTSHGTFFSKEGAEKQFCLAQGLEWTGGDSIDDYC